MKFTDNIASKTELQINKNQEEVRKLTLVGQLVPHKGHKVFKVNNETHEVSEPLYEKSIVWKVNSSIKENLPKLIVEEGFSYVVSMNKGNAKKKFLKGDNGSKFNK